MRVALSLLALGSTFFLAAAQPTLDLARIRAVNTAIADKDSWVIKGRLNGEEADLTALIQTMADEGLDAELQGGGAVGDTVTFDPEDCKVLAHDQGLTCKVPGSRLAFRRFVATTLTKPQAGVDAAAKNKTKNSNGLVEETVVSYKVWICRVDSICHCSVSTFPFSPSLSHTHDSPSPTKPTTNRSRAASTSATFW